MLALYENDLPHVTVTDIRWNEELSSLTVKSMTVVLTTTEYRLLFPLKRGTPVSYADLAVIVYDIPLNDKIRTMMDKHVDRIRGKLRGTGIYLYCMLGYGYILLPEVPSDKD